MSTIINNDPTTPGERVVRVENSSSAGWAVAVVVLIAVLLVGGYLFMRYRGSPAAAPATNGGANINVTIPTGSQTPDDGGAAQ